MVMLCEICHGRMFRQQHVISVFAQWLESTPLLVDNYMLWGYSIQYIGDYHGLSLEIHYGKSY